MGSDLGFCNPLMTPGDLSVSWEPQLDGLLRREGDCGGEPRVGLL